jgi:carbon monoxide dehydrogenase subunit G
MIIKSNQVEVNAVSTEIVEFLLNMENIYHILPQDKISDFKADKDQCSFKVQGGVMISLIQNGQTESREVYMRSGQGTPFPFKLTVFLTENGSSTTGYIHFDGEVNMFLKMMVEKPLTALFNYMSDRLKHHFEKQT